MKCLKFEKIDDKKLCGKTKFSELEKCMRKYVEEMISERSEMNSKWKIQVLANLKES